MADALENACAMMDMIFTAIKLEGGNVNTVHGTDIVLAYAAIAQAEQLKRIADLLDLSIQQHGTPLPTGAAEGMREYDGRTKIYLGQQP